MSTGWDKMNLLLFAPYSTMPLELTTVKRLLYKTATQPFNMCTLCLISDSQSSTFVTVVKNYLIIWLKYKLNTKKIWSHNI